MRKLIASMLIVIFSFTCFNTQAFAMESNTQNKINFIPPLKEYSLEYYSNEYTSYDTNGLISDRAIEKLKNINGYDNFRWLCSEQFNQYTQGKGDANCLPTAIANIFSYYDNNGVSMFGGNFTQSMYDNLCNLLSFDPNSGTEWSNADNAIKTFANQYGRTAKVDTYWLNLWSDITRDIDANKPILLNVPTGNNKYHAVVIVGYYIENGQKKVICLSGYGEDRSWLTEYNYSSNFKMKSVYIY